MNYFEYSVEDFTLDESFCKWILYQEDDSFWSNFLRHHPDKKDEIQQARQIVLTLSRQEHSLSESEHENLRLRIHQQIDTVEKSRSIAPVKIWMKLAASLSGIILLSVLTFLWLNQEDKHVYSTVYGEVKNITLPDGSTITLNANSELTWINEAEHRVVKLKGEAFFEVKKKADGQKFIVKSGDLLVEVLGTSFNVKQRREKTQVVLTSGKVALHHQSSGAKALMQPGDMVSLEEQNASFQHQQVNPELYTSWTDQKIIINNTTLGEIAATIEDTYGYEVHISGEELPQRKFTATTTVPLSELETLLRLIEITFEVEVRQQEQQIHIVPKKNRQ